MGQFNELIKREDIDQLSQSEGLNFDDDRIAILESMQSIDVQACPGSGQGKVSVFCRTRMLRKMRLSSA